MSFDFFFPTSQLIFTKEIMTIKYHVFPNLKLNHFHSTKNNYYERARERKTERETEEAMSGTLLKNQEGLKWSQKISNNNMHIIEIFNELI